MHLKPSEYLVLLAGGIRPLARLLNRAPSSVYNWTVRTRKSGESGNIPQQLHKEILKLAKEKSWDITTDDLLYGKTLKK